jgi:hypothetical protein
MNGGMHRILGEVLLMRPSSQYRARQRYPVAGRQLKILEAPPPR